MKKFLEVLKACPLFAGIDENDFEPMLSCLGGRARTYKKGENIFTEGEKAEYVGIVLSGSAQIVRLDYYGNRSILSTVVASEMFGESFGFAGVQSLPINVVATEDTAVLLIVCSKMISPCERVCSFHNKMIYNLLRIMATKNLIFNQRIEVTSKRTTRDKLMTYLLLQAKQKKTSTFVIPYDRQELADFLEVDRSGLSAEISKLRNEGVIECRKNKFKIL